MAKIPSDVELRDVVGSDSVSIYSIFVYDQHAILPHGACARRMSHAARDQFSYAWGGTEFSWPYGCGSRSISQNVV